MINLPIYHYNKEKRIALLDNSSIAFMHQLSTQGHSLNILFHDYDALLIPNWVFQEIKDSHFRLDYIQSLINAGFPIYLVIEEQYSNLLDQKDALLFDIFKSSVSSLGVLLRYLRQNVETEDLFDLAPSEEWIHNLYLDWPMSEEKTVSGRTKKKNAGEISLVILAEILSFYYPDIETLTIYTQDSDCYHFQQRAETRLKKIFPHITPINITYKSNDFILCQLYRNQQLELNNIFSLRTDFRTLTYTHKRNDSSIALITKAVNNDDFTTIIQSDSHQIIF